MQNHTTTDKRQLIKMVALFYLIANAIALPFFYWHTEVAIWLDSIGLPERFAGLGFMWGPGIAGMICFLIFKGQISKRITFAGSSVGKAILFYSAPFAIWTLPNVINPPIDDFSIITFLGLIAFGFLMIAGEELGWCWYLQDVLQNLKPWKRYVLIGIMWELWHAHRWLLNDQFAETFVRSLVFLVITVLLSALIGYFTQRTRTLLVAITFHTWINLFFEFAHPNTFIALGVSIIIWIFMLRKWKEGTVGISSSIRRSD